MPLSGQFYDNFINKLLSKDTVDTLLAGRSPWTLALQVATSLGLMSHQQPEMQSILDSSMVIKFQSIIMIQKILNVY